jgi:hypothetical protein
LRFQTFHQAARFEGGFAAALEVEDRGSTELAERLRSRQ